MRARPFFRIAPRVYFSRPGPRAGCLLRLVVLLLVLASTLAGQVTAVAAMRDGVAEIIVGNPTTGPLHVTVELFRDATPDGGAATLGPVVDALVSPAAFTLQPGEIQTVRIRVRELVRAGELLRLVTVMDPRVAPDTIQGARLTMVMRLITKIRAAP